MVFFGKWIFDIIVVIEIKCFVQLYYEKRIKIAVKMEVALYYLKKFESNDFLFAYLVFLFYVLSRRRLEFYKQFRHYFFQNPNIYGRFQKTTIIYHCSKCGKFLLRKTGASLHNCIGKINRNQNLNDVHKRALESFFQASNRNIANTILWSFCRAVICSSFKRRNVQF